MASPAYYTLSVVDVRSDDLEDFKRAVARHGNKPGMHHGKPEDTRKKDRCSLTLTFTFDADDDESSWEAYHSLVRSYAVAVGSGYSARTTTKVQGHTYSHAISPRRRKGLQWRAPEGKPGW